MSTRVHELAKELGLKARELLDRIQMWKLDVKSNVSATVEPAIADRIKELYALESSSTAQAKPAAEPTKPRNLEKEAISTTATAPRPAGPATSPKVEADLEAGKGDNVRQPSGLHISASVVPRSLDRAGRGDPAETDGSHAAARQLRGFATVQLGYFAAVHLGYFAAVQLGYFTADARRSANRSPGRGRGSCGTRNSHGGKPFRPASCASTRSTFAIQRPALRPHSASDRGPRRRAFFPNGRWRLQRGRLSASARP